MEGERLFVFNPETSRLELRSVVTGLTNWRFSEIVSGLQSGELVITSVDRQGLQDGVLVTKDDKSIAGREQ